MHRTSASCCVLLCVGLIPCAGSDDVPATVVVDASQAGPTIQPYLYGQFIEHTGRCIHDGIWAEMLQDRKFLWAPGKVWEKTGPESADFDVVHDPAGAYCGDHCMAIWVRDAAGGACGMRQTKLGLVAGREYVGYAVLQHVAEPGPVKIRLGWGDDPTSGEETLVDVGADRYQQVQFRFRAKQNTDAGSLSLTLAQPGYLWVACLSLMPADNVRGMRADTLALLKRLNAPIYRWPGGNVVSGYHWKDGTGPRDRRPPRTWDAVEDNDFGIDEFLDFCRELQTEPLIVVNTGLGSLAEAVEELEYVNGSAESHWGARRAAAGHPEPYRVKWWGLGNEMYGDWQLGHVPVEQYARRHNAFVRAMKQVDSGISVVAVGAPGAWNDVMVPHCVGQMDLLSGHHYTERHLAVPFSQEDARTYEANFSDYSGSVARGVRTIIDDFRRRQDGSDRSLDRIRLAIDEWGIVRDWNAPSDAPGVGVFEVYYTLGDAVAAGRALHEMIRAADVVQLGQWAQAVNILGAIKTNKTHASLDSVGHLLTLYRAHVGGRAIPVTVAGGAPLDVVAAVNAADATLSLGLINYSPTLDIALTLDLRGVREEPHLQAWRIDGPHLGAINAPGQPEEVTTSEVSASLKSASPLVLPRHSITVLKVQ